MSHENSHPAEKDSSTDELLRSVQQGDVASWNQLDRRYRERLTRILHGRIPSEMRARFDTDDVVQSTLFAAFSKIQDFETQSREGFRLWMNQILRNRLRTRIRFHRAQLRDASAEAGTFNEAGENHQASQDTHEVADGISRAIEGLSRLPERDQRFLRMRFFDKASYSAIGAAMGVSETTARRTITSLLIQLRKRS